MNSVINRIKTLKILGYYCSKSDKIHTNIQINGPKLVQGICSGNNQDNSVTQVHK